MSLIRVGSNSGYAAGWEAVFGGGRKAKAAGKTKAVKKAVRAARPAKSAKKRAAAKKARRR